MSKQSAKKMWMPAVWTVAIAIVGVAAIAGSSHLRARSARTSATQVPINAAQSSRVRANLDALPLAFEANQGQTDPQVKYMARGNGYKLFLTSSKAIMSLPGSKRQSEVLDMMMNKRRGAAGVRAMLKKRAASRKKVSPTTLQMNFLGGNAHPQLIAEDPQSGKVNYFIGKDRSQWHSNIPLYGRVNYRNVYPGVDLAFHGASKQLEFDYLVSPGADPKVIALSFDGADSVRTNESGDLIVATSAGPVELHRPVAYQPKNGGRETVDARFMLKSKNEVAFELGPYDHNRQLVIDPTVTYATYFGGGGADYGNGIAVDASGNAFIAGSTDSATIPGNPGAAVGTDVFVTELDPSGALVFSTIFGGNNDDFPSGIAIDTAGIYVAGTTDSNNLPTAGSAQPIFIGGATTGNNDAFAVKFDLNGAPLWATYIAGSDSDSALGVAVDTVTHAVYVVGETYSNNLGGLTGGKNPLPNGNAVNRGAGPGIGDGYIAALTPDGTAFTLISYIGGTRSDLATGVAVNQGNGDILVTGETISSDLATTPGVIQPKCGTDQNCNTAGTLALDDAFVVSIALTSSTPPPTYAYNYVTYYGGSKVDDAFGIAADRHGNAFVTGTTTSTDLLRSTTTYQNSLLGTQNAFLLELNSTGTAASYDTYFGGDATDFGLGIALDASNNVYLTGQSTSSSASFPLVNPTQGSGSGNSDAFVSVFSISQGQPLFSTLLGGEGDEDQFQGSIAVDSTDNIYVTGDTDSGQFPTQAPVSGGAAYGGGTCTDSLGHSIPCPDAFIAAYGPATNPDFTISATAPSPASVSPGASATSTITITPLNGYNGSVNLTCDVTGSGSPLPACSVNSTALTVTVTTAGASAAMQRSSGIFYAMWLPIVGLSLVGMGLSGAESRRRKLLGIFLLGIVMMGLFFMPACSSSSTTVGTCKGCTPPGTYTVTVTGTDSVNSSLSHAAQFTLTVQ